MVFLLFLIFLIKKKKFRGVKRRIKEYFKNSKESVWRYIFLIIIVISLEFILFLPIIIENVGLLGKDAYYWAKQVLFLLESGTVDYTELGLIYPSGFIFFCGGNLLLTPDFMTVYYFMKLGSLPFLNLYTILCLVIFKRLFKSNWLIFASLIMVISNLFFQYRTIQFLSSTISIYFILIGFMILLTDSSKYFLGLTIAGSFLINPIYSLYFSITILIFYIIKLSKNRRHLRELVKDLFFIIILALIFISPYIISIYIIYHNDLLSLINIYSSFFRFFSEEAPFYPIVISPITKISTLELIELIQEWLYFGFFLILPIIGILLTLRKKEERNRDFNVFAIIGTTFTLFMIFISPIFNLGRFFDIFYVRTLEVFLPLMVILIGYSIKAVIIYSQRLWRRFLIKKAELTQFLNHHQIFNKVINLPNFLIFLILSSSILVYAYSKNNFIYSYRYDDSILECVFYVRANISPNVPIGVKQINDTHTVYDLLYGFNLHMYNPIENLTLSQFSNFTQLYSLEYFIINLSSFNEQFINNFIANSTYVKLLGGADIFKYRLYSVF